MHDFWLSAVGETKLWIGICISCAWRLQAVGHIEVRVKDCRRLAVRVLPQTELFRSYVLAYANTVRPGHKCFRAYYLISAVASA